MPSVSSNTSHKGKEKEPSLSKAAHEATRRPFTALTNPSGQSTFGFTSEHTGCSSLTSSASRNDTDAGRHAPLLATPSIPTQLKPEALTDKEALRLLSTHPGLAQQYQDFTSERLKAYMAVVDEGYKKRLEELEHDFQSFRMAVSKLLNVRNDTQNGTSGHQQTFLHWKGPLHHGDGFKIQPPEVSPTWYRPAADADPSHTQPADGLPLVQPPPNKVTPLILPNGSTSQTLVPIGESSTKERLAPELVNLKVDGQLAGTFRLALVGHSWEHPGISFVLRASPAAGVSKYTGLIGNAVKRPKLKDFVIERTPENLMLLLEAHHQLRDRKLRLTTLWHREVGLPAPSRTYCYEGPTTPSSKLWLERTRFKPFTNLAVKVPLPGVTDPLVAFGGFSGIQTRRLLFSRGVVQSKKGPKAASYVDVLSGRNVNKQKNDIVFPESENYLCMLAHFAASLRPEELAAMELASSNHHWVADDNRVASPAGMMRPKTNTSQAQLAASVGTAVSASRKGNNADTLHNREGGSSFVPRAIQPTDSCFLRSIPSWPRAKPLAKSRTEADAKRPEAITYQVKPIRSLRVVNEATSGPSQKAMTSKRAATGNPADHDRPLKFLKTTARSEIKVEPKIKVEGLESGHPIARAHRLRELDTGEIEINSSPCRSLSELHSLGQTKVHGYYGSQAAWSSPVLWRRHSYHDYDSPSAYQQHNYNRVDSFLNYDDIPHQSTASGHGRPDRRASI
jgi:hypothetical protein